MLKNGDILENVLSGEKMVFWATTEETRGEYLSYDYYLKPFSPVEPKHFHPMAEQRFTVKQGEFTLNMNNETKTYFRGDSGVIAPYVSHHGWNHGIEDVILDFEIHPALDFETWFTKCIELVDSKRSDKNGKPKFIDMAVMSHEMKNLSFLPNFVMVQKVCIYLIGTLSKIIGYKV